MKWQYERLSCKICLNMLKDKKNTLIKLQYVQYVSEKIKFSLNFKPYIVSCVVYKC